MSQFKYTGNTPAVHIPTFTKYGIYQSSFIRLLESKGIDTFPETDDFILDGWFYFADLDGWAKVVPDLIVNSKLYKDDIFDCEDYALKAQVNCAERFGLNSFRLCIGVVKIDGKDMWHGFNIFPVHISDTETDLMLFEPNEGYEWSGQGFNIGENGYTPKMVFIPKPK